MTEVQRTGFPLYPYSRSVFLEDWESLGLLLGGLAGVVHWSVPAALFYGFIFTPVLIVVLYSLLYLLGRAGSGLKKVIQDD